MLEMTSLFSTENNFVLAERKNFPSLLAKALLTVEKDRFISHDAVTQSLLSKLHLFVSLSREFSKYIETFAAGFTLVQTVFHDVFAGLQSETIWFKIENVSEEKM